MIVRNYEVVIRDRYFALEVSIGDGAGGSLRLEVDHCDEEGRHVSEVPASVMAELERLVDLDGEAIRRDLDEAAYDQAIDAKISERKEGGN